MIEPSLLRKRIGRVCKIFDPLTNCEEHKIVVAWFLITIFMIMATSMNSYNKKGGDDFYHHAAVVNEIIHNPLSPKHPFFGNEESTPYMSPYNVVVALFARTSRLNAIDAMHVFGLLNIFIFMMGLMAFVKAYNSRLTLWPLLFVFLLYGGMLSFIGFSYRIIPRAAPYHSVFTMGIMLFTFAIAIKGRLASLILLPLLAAISILSQPITIFAATIVTSAMLWLRFGSLKKSIIPIIVFGLVTVSLILAWPYYSMFGILHNISSSGLTEWTGLFPLYDPLVLLKILWPALLVTIVVHKYLLRHKELLIALMCMLLPYLIMAPRNSEMTGRGMTYIIHLFLLLLGLAYWDKLRESSKNWWSIPFVIMLFIYNLGMGSIPIMRRDQGFISDMKEEMPIIARHIGHYDMVITDLQTAYYLLPHSGKVTATVFASMQTEDGVDSTKDIQEFYDPNTSNQRRKYILEKNGANLVLLNKIQGRTIRTEFAFDKTSPALRDSIMALGRIVSEMDNLVLISVDEY